MESDLQSLSSDKRVGDSRHLDGTIDFLEVLNNEDMYFWCYEMAEDNDFSRFFRWKHAEVGKLGYERWDDKARLMAYRLSGKYGCRLGTGCDGYSYGPGSKMRTRCLRAQKSFEKNSYYWS